MTGSERVTLRISVEDLQGLDMFVGAGEFQNRSDAIRHAIKELLRNHSKVALEGMNARKQFQEAFIQMQQMKEQLEQQQETLQRLMRK